jgi:hypothetical protein
MEKFKSKVASAEIDMVEAQADIIRIQDAREEQVDPTQAGPSGKVTRTGDTPWTLLDGIKWNEERVFYGIDGMPICQIKLKAPGIVANPIANNRVLARFLPEGSIREIMIDFTEPGLDSQNPAGAVPPEKCPRCEKIKAALG